MAEKQTRLQVDTTPKLAVSRINTGFPNIDHQLNRTVVYYSMNPLLKAAILGFTLAATLHTSGCSTPSHTTSAGPTDAVPIGATQSPQAIGQEAGISWKNVPTQTITAGGVNFAYRELGKSNGGTPVVFLAHLAAVLDNWDPRIVDGIAAKHHVIAFDNRGIGRPAAHRRIR